MTIDNNNQMTKRSKPLYLRGRRASFCAVSEYGDGGTSIFVPTEGASPKVGSKKAKKRRDSFSKMLRIAEQVDSDDEFVTALKKEEKKFKKKRRMSIHVATVRGVREAQEAAKEEMQRRERVEMRRKRRLSMRASVERSITPVRKLTLGPGPHEIVLVDVSKDWTPEFKAFMEKLEEENGERWEREREKERKKWRMERDIQKMRKRLHEKVPHPSHLVNGEPPKDRSIKNLKKKFKKHTN